MRSTASLCLFAIVLAACGGNSSLPTATDASPNLRSANAHQATRPLSGTCTLQFDPPPFPLPPVHHQTDVGTCVLSHLGNTAFYGEQDIDFAAGTQSGWRRLTAANGDELHGVHAGTSWPAGPGVIGFSATMTITGGTGRFANATGQVTLSGEATLATRTTVARFDGSLTY